MLSVYYIPFFIWALILTVASLSPADELPSHSLFEYDKLLHFAFHGIWMLLWLWAAAQKRVEKRLNSYIWAGACIAAYGLLMEVIQGIMPLGRFFDVYDLIANVSGIIAAGISAYFIFPRLGYGIQ